MALIDDLKTMLFIDSADETNDAVLALIIKNTNTSLLRKLRLPKDADIPDELADIPLEISVRRFNRLKNEGMASYSQEGESITFKSSDFDDFQQDIDDWLNTNGKNNSTLGTVNFINGYGGGQ